LVAIVSTEFAAENGFSRDFDFPCAAYVSLPQLGPLHLAEVVPRRLSRRVHRGGNWSPRPHAARQPPVC
jgi:hypothetical protein